MSGPLLWHYTCEPGEELGVSGEDALIHPHKSLSYVFLTNISGYTRHLEGGEILGEATPVTVVDPQNSVNANTTDQDSIAKDSSTFTVTTLPQHHHERRVALSEDDRQQKLRKSLQEPNLPPAEKATLMDFLCTHHNIFSLEDGERGETDLIQMQIDTGDATPKRQSARRIPHALRQEVAYQLQKMQEQGVIEPSSSPWASPVVLVKKRDGTHRFCVDYRQLNLVTKPDRFPLPRIEDLLDSLGQSAYFSTLDLASGFWQIRLHQDSKERLSHTEDSISSVSCHLA